MKLLIILSLMALLTLAACGGETVVDVDDTPAEVVPEPSIDPTPEELEAELDASELDDIEADLDLLDI